MPREQGPFALGVGTKLFIPEGAVTRPSRNATTHPETPTVYLLEGRGDEFRFKERSADQPYKPAFKLFAPDGLKADDLVVVTWRDPTCACARRATPDERLAATFSGGCTMVI